MSTAVDTAFEELMATQDGQEPPGPLHLVCLVCHPVTDIPVPTVCGTMTTGRPPGPEHVRRCAKCVALDLPRLPCGH